MRLIVRNSFFFWLQKSRSIFPSKQIKLKTVPAANHKLFKQRAVHKIYPENCHGVISIFGNKLKRILPHFKIIRTLRANLHVFRGVGCPTYIVKIIFPTFYCIFSRKYVSFFSTFSFQYCMILFCQSNKKVHFHT